MTEVGIHRLLKSMWQQYTQDNPDILKIYNLFLDRDEVVVNDHIAIRTFDHPKICARKLAQFFVPYGYKKAGSYRFSKKKLEAIHLQHSDKSLPKIFISELKLEQVSWNIRQPVARCLASIEEDIFESESLLTAGALWQPLSLETYKLMLRESEYAAWLYAFGFRANHFTVSVNHLESLQNLEEVNQMITAAGYALNDVGGVIKGGEDEMLEQSSTLANKVQVPFVEGETEVPGSYYEFAMRHKDPQGNFFQGFVTESADKIFESTHTNQTTKT